MDSTCESCRKSTFSMSTMFYKIYKKIALEIKHIVYSKLHVL